KYIQSNIGNVFKNVKNDLSDGRYVLFSGTSCQVAGLKSFLKVDYDNLICIDIVCHGVPSPAVWHSYLEWLEKKNKGRCIDVDFRNKEKFGWAAHVETLKFEKNNRAKIVDSEVFKKLFYGHVILRPSCHKCPYKSINHPGDITIGDFWGIDTATLGFNDNKGVSLVLVNNDKGRVLFEDVSDTVILRECRIEDSMQPPLKAPANASKQRDKFWIDYYTRPFGYIVRKYGGRNIKGRIKKLFNAFFRKG
ncbi:MAG: Coenzyme F420 hydrogenase/dehydrogenase, beta subunit C-terminal domain, partial [Candidatus Ornithomonoglobus sp.]